MHTTGQLICRLLALCLLAASAVAQEADPAEANTATPERLPLVREALENIGVPPLPVEVSTGLASTLPDRAGLPQQLLPPQKAASESRHWLSQQQQGRDAQRQATLVWRIWRRLLPTNLQMATASPILHPWLVLLDLLRDPLQTLTARQAVLTQWKQDHPDHPALRIANHVERLLELQQAAQKRRFAILLPQSGPLNAAGDSIAAGIRIAWFAQHGGTAAGPVPELLFLDSTLPPSQLVNAILSEKIDLVIGPLDKTLAAQFVEAMRIHSNHPQTLLLNRLDKGTPDTAFWQFGLPVEQEIASLVHFAKSHGLRRAGALMIDTPAGLRAGTALEDLWLDLGGEWVGTEIVSGRGELTEAGKDLLLLDTSVRRAQLLQRVINRRLQSTPRPRQDLDVLFIAAPGARGLEVTAALAYNYLKEVPLYSLASIYQPQRLVNEFDLEGVRFMDMPWMVKPVAQLGYDEEFSQARYRHRLLAFGIDALALAQRIASNTLGDRLPHWGVTGLLTTNRQQRVEWIPVPVVIRRGVPELLAP